MDRLLGLLSFIPFVITDDDFPKGNRRVGFNWPDFLRTVFAALVVAGAGALVTIQVLKNDMQHIKEQNGEFRIKLEQTCSQISNMVERIAIVETRQQERLERERIQGLRR